MKKIISCLLAILTLFFQTGLAFAEECPIYSIQNAKRKDVQRELNSYFSLKDYSMITSDDENGIYYIEPTYMGSYVPKYLIILKQDGNDTLLYSSADYSNLRTTQLIVKYLKSKKLNPLHYSDDDLNLAFNNFSKDYKLTADKKVAMFGKGIKIESLNQNKKDIKQKLKDETDYSKLVSIDIVPQPFSSNLKKKYEGYIFTVKNNSKDELKITNIDFYNNFQEKQALQSVLRVITPGAATMYVLGGTLALFTFGISLALLPVGVGMVNNENLPVQNELKQFLNNSNNSETIQANEDTNIKVIGYKTPAISKMPYVKVKFINTRTGKEFEVNNRPDVLKEY